MNKYIIPLLIALSFVFPWDDSCYAQINHSYPSEDSKELMIKDILMLLLGKEIEKVVSDYYSDYLTESPMVYPYQVDIVNVERVDGFRSFHFLITLETTPVVGPHISVGKDRITFEIAPTIPGDVKLNKFEHLETHDLPPHWQHIIKQK
ncbi:MULTISPECIES: DUF3888 domain-containing protein [Heyndrickxia]|uniref:DUF3888 domain-containing protein n=1 Tax=Heyndrickxia TaxID=2837504 RepID=UPI001B063884|nr:DUF3888 domain-containing protein [Heyndrickxia oleronia]GIN39423.1 hypothetical protein J19TS1_23720 [Heyndrickxia oleronia]